MEKDLKKTRFISYRIALFTGAAGLFGVFLIYSYFRQVLYGTADIFAFVVMIAGFTVLIAGVCFGIVRPYMLWKRRVEQFLDGYLPFEEIDRQDIMLTPYTYLEEKKISEILNSTQVVNLNKRQAQYLALQNQINPHFLYNTLDGIRSEALIAGVGSVAEMTEALAAFFRYTISKTENMVAVEEELDNCKTYFKIQQYRFGDRLKLHIDCDEEDREEILRCQIPKLTLQPILENSIIHGTELKIGTGNLTIRLGMIETRLLIKISDDGVGMNERTLEELNEKLGKTVEQFNLQKDEKRGGIALVNVNNRIQLLFGKEYGMHIFSIEGVGTDVEITIPIIKNEREWKKRSV